MNGFKFRRCYDTKLNLYRYNNQAVFNLTNDLLDFLIISKSKIKNFKLHRYASFIPTWITKESALLFKEVVNTDDVRDSVFYPWNYPQWSMNHGKLHNGVRRNGMIRFSINLQNEMFKYIHICGRDKRSENRFSFYHNLLSIKVKCLQDEKITMWYYLNHWLSLFIIIP